MGRSFLRSRDRRASTYRIDAGDSTSAQSLRLLRALAAGRVWYTVSKRHVCPVRPCRSSHTTQVKVILMKRSTALPLLVAAALSTVGCSDGYETAPSYDSGVLAPATSQAPEPTTNSATISSRESQKPAPASGPTAEAPGHDSAHLPAMEEPAETPPSPSSPPPTAALPAASAPPPAEPTPAAAQQPSIRLSAGVALPQSLPTGTAMGFSVDYQFSGGSPSTSSPYAWVIEPSKGQRAIRPVRLSSEGTLQDFFQQFRPENGPFSTHIEDANGNQLSRPLPLR